jgi:N utilization substance protein A
VREAERETSFNEYSDRQWEIITGMVRRFEKGELLVDLGRAEAVLPTKEQMPREVYRPGDRIRAIITEIRMTTKGPQIILSRTHPSMLAKLFELEVPEIAEGIVEINAVVRDPGSRAKIAVSSNDSDVDPVGACVGMRGARVQNVVSELRGEKIDIIPWSEDIARFACNALSPAQVSKVFVDEDHRVLEIVVADDQLSLAIGKRGQNVSLAARLTGCRIDIKSESKAAEAELSQFASFDGTQLEQEEEQAAEETGNASEVENAGEVENADVAATPDAEEKQAE